MTIVTVCPFIGVSAFARARTHAITAISGLLVTFVTSATEGGSNGRLGVGSRVPGLDELFPRLRRPAVCSVTDKIRKRLKRRDILDFEQIGSLICTVLRSVSRDWELWARYRSGPR